MRVWCSLCLRQCARALLQMLLAEARLLAAPPAAARSSGAPAPNSAPVLAPAAAGQQPPAHAAGGADALADEAALRRAFAGVLAENGQLHLCVNAALRAQLQQRPEGAPQHPTGPHSTSISGAKGSAAPDADGTGIPHGNAEPEADTRAKAERAVDEKAGPSLAGSLFSRLVAFGGGSGGDAGGAAQPPGSGAAGATAHPKPAQTSPPAPAVAARNSATSALARGAGWAAGWVGSNRTGSGPAAPKPGQSPSAAMAQGDADRGMLRAPSGALQDTTSTPPARAASGVPAQLKGSRAPGAQPARQGPGAGVRPKAPPATPAAPGPAAGSAAASGARGESAPGRHVPPVQVGRRQAAPGPQGAANADPGSGLSPVSDAGNAPPAGDAPLLDFSGLTVFGAGSPGQGPDANSSPPGGAPAREDDALNAWAAGVGGGGALLGEAKGGVDRAGSAASGHGIPANGQLAAGLRELDGQQSLI